MELNLTHPKFLQLPTGWALQNKTLLFANNMVIIPYNVALDHLNMNERYRSSNDRFMSDWMVLQIILSWCLVSLSLHASFAVVGLHWLGHWIAGWLSLVGRRRTTQSGQTLYYDKRHTAAAVAMNNCLQSLKKKVKMTTWIYRDSWYYKTKRINLSLVQCWSCEFCESYLIYYFTVALEKLPQTIKSYTLFIGRSHNSVQLERIKSRFEQPRDKTRLTDPWLLNIGRYCPFIYTCDRHLRDKVFYSLIGCQKCRSDLESSLS